MWFPGNWFHNVWIDLPVQYMFHKITNAPWKAELEELFGAEDPVKGYTTFGAFFGNELVGAGCLHYSQGQKYMMRKGVVHPAHRGLGVHRGLIIERLRYVRDIAGSLVPIEIRALPDNYAVQKNAIRCGAEYLGRVMEGEEEQVVYQWPEIILPNTPPLNGTAISGSNGTTYLSTPVSAGARSARA